MKKILLFVLLITGTLSAQEVQRNIVIEHFTNTRCSICASKNPAFFNTIDNYSEVIHLAFHPTSPYSSCIFAQHDVAGNDGRTTFYGIYGGTPRVVVNGSVVSVSTPMINDSRIQSEQNLTSPFDISIQQSTIADDTLVSEITINTVAPTALTSVKLYVALSEQLIQYNAPNGENNHHNVFRHAPNGLNGNTITLPTNGNSATFTFKTVIDQEWSIPQLTTTAVLQDTQTKEIYQGAQSEKVGGTVSVSEVVEVDNAFYPNPVKETLNIRNSDLQISSVAVYNIIGSKVKELDVSNLTQTNINMADVSNGNYIIRFTDKNQQVYTRKLVVNK